MNKNSRRFWWHLLLAGFVLASVLRAEAGTVVLKRAFINKYKNRATIVATFVVDKAHAKPNPPKKDSDMHVAGRAAQQVGLPMVAEVMNAAGASQAGAVTAIHAREQDHQAISITGAWRLWFEHPSSESQIQFDTVPPADTTNPDHCFQIHPITKFAGQDVGNSFQNIVGYKPYDAKTAFSSYNKLRVRLNNMGSSVAISSTKTGHNYVEFYLSFLGKPKSLADNGYVALADVSEESEGAPVAENIRMIFVPGTLPADWVKSNSPAAGTEVHVLGIPRINLNAIATFIDAAGPGQTSRQLPYEIIIVAVLP